MADKAKKKKECVFFDRFSLYEILDIKLLRWNEDKNIIHFKKALSS